jgi:hypothetical protein
MTDPIVQSHLTLEDAWRLTEAMIEAEAEWLPAWLGGQLIEEDRRASAISVGGGAQ